MHMKRTMWPLLAAGAVFLTVPFLIAPATTLADSGGAGVTMSFFSGGNGAHADWLATLDQPPGDLDNQAIRLLTTDGAPTYAKGVRRDPLPSCHRHTGLRVPGFVFLE